MPRVQGSSANKPELERAQQSSAFARLPPEQQRALEQENQALVSELSSLNQASNSPESLNAESALWSSSCLALMRGKHSCSQSTMHTLPTCSKET